MFIRIDPQSGDKIDDNITVIIDLEAWELRPSGVGSTGQRGGVYLTLAMGDKNCALNAKWSRFRLLLLVFTWPIANCSSFGESAVAAASCNVISVDIPRRLLCLRGTFPTATTAAHTDE